LTSSGKRKKEVIKINPLKEKEENERDEVNYKRRLQSEGKMA